MRNGIRRRTLKLGWFKPRRSPLYESAFVGQTHEIRLKPGSYKITMLITYQKCHGCQKMVESQFDLKAGHIYILDKNEAQYFWWTLDERDLSGQEISIKMF